MGLLPKSSGLSIKLLNLLGIFLIFTLLACGGGGVGGGLGLGSGGALDVPSGNGEVSGGTTNQSPGLDHDAVGPTTDYTDYKLNMDCQPIACIISNPNIPGGEEDGGGCDTYTLVFNVTLNVGPMVSANNILRVFNPENQGYNDYLTDANGKATIKAMVDSTPQLEFYVPRKLKPEEFVASDIWKSCPNSSCIQPEEDFTKVIQFFMGDSCNFLSGGTDSNSFKIPLTGFPLGNLQQFK